MKLNYYEAENIRVAIRLNPNSTDLKNRIKEKYGLTNTQFNNIIMNKSYNKKPKEKTVVRQNARLNQHDADYIRQLYHHYMNEVTTTEEKNLENFNNEFILNDFGYTIPIRRLNDIIKGRTFKK